MSSEDRKREALEAQTLLENEMLLNVLIGTEEEAIDRCLYAAPEDHDARQAAAAEARAAREIRAKLQAIVDAGQPQKRVSQGAPA